MKTISLAAMIGIIGNIGLFVGIASIGRSIQGASVTRSNPEVRQRMPAKDIYPESLSRLPKIKREDLDNHGKRIFDAILNPEQRYPGSLSGPVGLWLYSPDLAEHMFAVRTYLRFETQFDQRSTELAALVTARELNNQYIWSSHEQFALKAGLAPEIIEIVKNRSDVQDLSEKDAVIITFGRELIGAKKVNSQTFARALGMFAGKGVMDLSAIMGFYSFVATTLNTFDVQPESR